MTVNTESMCHQVLKKQALYLLGIISNLGISGRHFAGETTSTKAQQPPEDISTSMAFILTRVVNVNLSYGVTQVTNETTQENIINTRSFILRYFVS